jgi:hypothetical protein
MGQMTRHCRECGGEQLFDQPHAGQECCPDVPDSDCPEWACTGCGAALFVGIHDLRADAATLRAWSGRVA